MNQATDTVYVADVRNGEAPGAVSVVNGATCNGTAGTSVGRLAAPMMRGTPVGEAGTPDAIGHAAVYLASDEAAFVHGTVIDVDGGRTNIAVMAN